MIVLQLTFFTFYLIFSWSLTGKPLPSLSDSWYELRKKGRLWPALFTVTLWTVGFPMTQIGNEWFEYGGVCLMLVGTAPLFKMRVVRTFHVAGAWGSIGFCCWGLIEQGIYYPAAIIIVTGILAAIVKFNNTTWWVEVIAFYSIETGLIQADL